MIDGKTQLNSNALCRHKMQRPKADIDDKVMVRADGQIELILLDLAYKNKELMCDSFAKKPVDLSVAF
jgi:hypothetical protein